MIRVTATLKNDIRSTSITVHGMGPDINTLYVSKELAAIIFDVLVGFDIPHQPGCLGTHGPQEWTIKGSVLHRIINEDKTA
jgi:hypothetical protein